MFKKLALVTALTLALGTSQAATVFNNGAPDLVAGSGMTEFVVADNFTVSGGPFDLTNIRFFSAQDTASAYVGSVAWSLFSNVASAPGVSLFSGLATVAGVPTAASTGFGYGIYTFDIPLVAITLSAGSYWLALHNGPLTNTTSAGDMTWATSGVVGLPGAGVYFDGSSWVSTGNEHAFRIDGNPTVINPTPEPGSIALVLAGLALCGALRQKRSH